MLQSDLALQAKLLAGSLQLPLPDTGRIAEVAPLASVPVVAGKVEEQLRDGQFRVQVEGRSVSMQLPPDTRIGQQVRLIRIPDTIDAYGLAEESPHDSGVAASVSSGGRMLAALLAKQPDPTGAKANAATPVLQSVPLPKTEIALKLAQALGSSGLFYEAHQARWLDGQRSLASLLEEPQGRLSPRLAAPQRFPPDRDGQAAEQSSGRSIGAAPGTPRPVGDPRAAAQAQVPSAVAERMASGAAETREARSGPDTSAVSDLALPSPRSPDGPAHPATESIIQQQISTLESGQILWHGQIWPGQDMEWLIEESPQEAGREAPEPGWRTALHLDLTILGSVEAQLNLRAGKLTIQLKAEDEAVRDLFRTCAPDLVRAMSDAGLAVDSLEVQGHA